MTELHLLISHTSSDQVIRSSVIRACCQITSRLIVNYMLFRNPQNNKSAAFIAKQHTDNFSWNHFTGRKNYTWVDYLIIHEDGLI